MDFVGFAAIYRSLNSCVGSDHSMAFHLGIIIGAAAILLLVLVIVLAIGKIRGLRNHPRAMHIVAVVIVWIIAAVASAQDAEVAISAYLITLTAIWNYRRELRKTASGWYRLGAGLTVLWFGFGILVWTAFAQDTADSMSVLVMTWTFAALGLSPWLLGWLIQWIREGFAQNNKTSV
jgi:hypothetical protein